MDMARDVLEYGYSSTKKHKTFHTLGEQVINGGNITNKILSIYISKRKKILFQNHVRDYGDKLLWINNEGKVNK
jgi:hypothetical protein